MKTIAVLTLLFSPLIGFACSCKSSGISKSYSYSNIIFYGKHLASKSSSDFYDVMGVPYKIEVFEVKKMYKGIDYAGLTYSKEFGVEKDKQFISILSTCEASCGMCFEPNKNYLVYCYQDFSGHFTTNGCTRTREIVTNDFITTIPFDPDINQDEDKVLSELARHDTTTISHTAIAKTRAEELLDLQNENGDLKEKLAQSNQKVTFLMILIGTVIVLFLIKNIAQRLSPPQ